MHLQSFSFVCLTFLIQYVSSQSHIVVTQTTTLVEVGQVETNIFSIDSNEKLFLEVLQPRFLRKKPSFIVSAIIASNTIDAQESVTDGGVSDNVELKCSVHDGNQGDCIGIIVEINSGSTILTTTTLATTFPPGGLFGSLPTGTGVSSSSSQSTPAPSPPPSSTVAPTPTSTPAPASHSPSSSSSLTAPGPLPTSSPSPTSSSVSSLPQAVTKQPPLSVTSSSTSAITTPSTSSTTSSTSPTLGPSNINTQLPALNSGSSLSFSLFPQVGILMATYILSIFAA